MTDKNNKFLAIGFVVNFCLTLVSLYLVGIVYYAGICKVNLLAVKTPAAQCEQAAPASQQSATTVNGQTAAPETVVSMEVNDSGFLTKELSINLSGPAVLLTIKNTGTTTHSFVIDNPAVNVGDIAPGESKDVHLGNYIFDPDKEYTFYSNSSGDSKDIFSGTLKVTQN
jgi:uncharacterized cupredoxin-like copper-binding protein